MKTANHRLRDQGGYSMVEVLAAIVLLSLAIIPMVSMFDAGLRSAVLGGNYEQARALANSNLEVAKVDPSSVPVEDDPDGCLEENSAFQCSLEVEQVHVSPGSDSADFESGPGGEADLSMTKVTVTVEWDGNEYVTSGVVGE